MVVEFVNILARSEYRSDVLWVSRYLEFTKAFIAKDRRISTHEELKNDVINSEIMEAVRELEMETNPTELDHLHAEVEKILNEIGYSRSLPTIRWLALVTIKIIKRILDGIFVNEANLLELKASMGDTPFIFVPTHRSYSDFILMAFVCFAYEIEIPCVAAGLDFLGMWGMGEVLRKTKAFFMRRTFHDDQLYKIIFKQYISNMVSQGDSPIEFFIEGTRSRTGKSLKPKYGMLSMILRPFLEGEVPDIKFVPVSITYDRYLEEWLFVREILGTPKPKESTKGLFKVFSILNNKYGNVYFHFGEPISLLDTISRGVEIPLPRFVSKDAVKIASLITQCHSKLQVFGVFHLVMVVIYDHFISREELEMPLIEVIDGVRILLVALSTQGVNVLLIKGNLRQEIYYACSVHPELLTVSGDKLRFLGSHPMSMNSSSTSNALDIDSGSSDPQKVVIMMLYVNPAAMVLFSPSILMAVVDVYDIESDVIDVYEFFCELYENEFPAITCNMEKGLDESKQLLITTGCITPRPDEGYSPSSNYPLMNMLHSIINPYNFGYLVISLFINQFIYKIEYQKLFVECQKRLLMTDKCISPFYTTKSFLTNCLSGLINVGCLYKDGSAGEDIYTVDSEKISFTISLLRKVTIYSEEELALKNKL